MRKEWHWIGVIGLLLTACTTTTETPQQSSAPAYNGPVVEISGVEPRYEPYNPNTGQDYEMGGKTYRIVKNPQNFSETGLASSYGAEHNGTTTATGEPFDAQALAAAHPTLPLPSYVRVTNLSNGRQLVVRVNDRGPYTPGRIIDLTEAAAERLNISNQTTVKVDFIQVAPDGTLSGPGTIGTVVAKQNYALPPRPNLDAPSPGAMQSSAPVDDTRVASGTAPAPAIRPVADPVPAEPDMAPAPSASGSGSGFLGRPTPLPAGVVESDEPAPAAPQPAATYQPSHTSAAPAATYTPSHASAAPAATYTKTHVSAAATAPASGRYVVQVGALGDKQRALAWQKTLGERFGVPGKVTANGNLYRVQLGPFSSRQQAAALQQRLTSEAQQQSFITAAPE